MDELTVIKNTAQIIKYCKENVCERCLFYEGTHETTKCMWHNSTPDYIELENIITKWVDINE